jgi:predicted PurR-regulated permease PerM
VEADKDKMTPSPTSSTNSPRWGSTLKLVVGLTLIGLIFVIIIFFRSILGPLFLAFILTYLLHPLAVKLTRITRFSWKWSVNIIFLVLLIILIGLFTATGVIIVQQIQSLIRIIQSFLSDLPKTLDTLSKQTLSLGPFQLEFSNYLDLSTLSDQFIQGIQLVIGRAGLVVSTFATGAASTIGWALFVLLIAYFTLSDVGQMPDAVKYIQIPGYDYDIRRISRELGKIWNAFLRGQIIIAMLIIITYSVVLSILGIRYALGLALLTGLAHFVPYIGPLIATLITFLVAIFQPDNYYNLAPLVFALIVVGVCFILNQIFDNYVSPRIIGDTLGINPAAVLVAAILAASFIGLVGLLIAAPILATLMLSGQYVIRKLFDLDPWPEPEPISKVAEPSLFRRVIHHLQRWWSQRRGKTD